MLTDMLQYLRYIKIKYPARLQIILDSIDSFSINLIPNIPDEVIYAFPNSALPDNFQKYELPSDFFVNFWSSGITLLALGMGFLAVYLLEKCTKGCLFYIFSYLLHKNEAHT